MSDTIEWVLELKLADGKREAVQALIEEMSAATMADEPGAQVYEYYLSEDGGTVTVLERYADSAAAMVHMTNFGEKFAPRFLAMLTPVSFRVFGPASDELREALAAVGASHHAQIAGFAR